MTRGGVMDMSSFDLSFKSSGNDSISEDLSNIINKMSTTGRQLLSELESAKKEASGRSSRLAESLAKSVSFNLPDVKKSSPEKQELQKRCEKLEDVVLFLLQENASLSRFQREANKLCARCKNSIEGRHQKRSTKPGSQIHVCTDCSKHVKLVMDKAAELQLENDKHILRICKLEEVINTNEEKQENVDTYKRRIEELHNQLLIKETEIESLKDEVAKDAVQKGMITSVVQSRDVCNRKEVLQLCEKYEHLQKVSKKMENDLAKMHHEKMEAATKITDLERQLHQSLKREKSNKRQLEERKAFEKMQALERDLPTMTTAHAYQQNSTLPTHQVESTSYNMSDRVVRPRSILKKSSHKKDIPSTITSTSFAIGKQNPIIINEKRSTTAAERCYQPPYKYPKGILDVGKKEDTSYSSFNDTSSSSDSSNKSNNYLNVGDLADSLTKSCSYKDHCETEITSPSSTTSEHIGRYEFLQEMSHLHAKGKTHDDVEVGLSARQQEYADKLIKKYTKGLSLSGQSY